MLALAAVQISMTRWLFAALLLSLGCSSVDAAPQDAMTAPACDIDPQLALAAGEAIRLWGDAAGQPIPLPSRIELADFGADREHAAVWSAELDVLQVSALTPSDQRVSSIAHELGHSLGLQHMPGTGDLMDPDRPHAARVAPCVSVDDVAAAGFTGPGACE